MWVEWNEWWWEKDNATMSSVDSVRVCDVDLKECDGDVRGSASGEESRSWKLLRWGADVSWSSSRSKVALKEKWIVCWRDSQERGDGTQKMWGEFVDNVRVHKGNVKEREGDVRGGREAMKAEAEMLWGEEQMWIEVRAEVKWRLMRDKLIFKAKRVEVKFGGKLSLSSGV